jgi:hypothetical protein
MDEQKASSLVPTLFIQYNRHEKMCCVEHFLHPYMFETLTLFL